MLAVVRELVCHYRYRALCRVLGKTEPLLKVDLAARMGEAFLDVLFPAELWPEEPAVRELATSIKKAKGPNKSNPFINVELKKCGWRASHCFVSVHALFMSGSCPQFALIIHKSPLMRREPFGRRSRRKVLLLLRLLSALLLATLCGKVSQLVGGSK